MCIRDRFLSKSCNEAFARITVAAFVSQLDPTIEELSDIKTAVSEAVTNCIIHGYEDCEGIIKIKARIIRNNVEIEISDTGRGLSLIHISGIAQIILTVVGAGAIVIAVFMIPVAIGKSRAKRKKAKK